MTVSSLAVESVEYQRIKKQAENLFTMKSALELLDPGIYEHLKQNLDMYEIRGEEAELLDEWFSRMVFAESILSLVRKGVVDVVGIQEMEDGTFSPMIKNNPRLELLVNTPTDTPDPMIMEGLVDLFENPEKNEKTD